RRADAAHQFGRYRRRPRLRLRPVPDRPRRGQGRMKPRAEVTIRGRKVSDTEPAYIVGEIACGHQGSVEQCKALIDAAAAAHADAVQLEFFYPPANMVGSLQFYNLIEDLAFTRDQWASLMAHARTHDIAVSAFVYDDVSMDW